MGIKGYIVLIILGVLTFVGFDSVYILDQRQSALILQFGKPVDQEVTPGLKFKLPFVTNVVRFDNRIQNIDFHPGSSSELLAMDQKTMKLDAYAKYRIVNPLKFYQTVMNESTFRLRMGSIIDSSIREAIGSVKFKDVLRASRDDIMHKVTVEVNNKAQAFGVDVVDVRITRLSLPDRARSSVYERMRTERGKEAKEIRAEGARKARIIKANADKEKAILLANARNKAQVLQGEGDSEAIDIYSKVYSQDPGFFEFYRSLEAYKKALNKDNTTLLLSSDKSDFLKFLDRK